MFGLFDPPLTKQRKSEARNARLLRESAARECAIEIRILLSALKQAEAVRMRLGTAGKPDQALVLLGLEAQAQESLDACGLTSRYVETQQAGLQDLPNETSKYEKIRDLELEAREALSALKDRCKQSAHSLGVAALEAQRELGDFPNWL